LKVSWEVERGPKLTTYNYVSEYKRQNNPTINVLNFKDNQYTNDETDPLNNEEDEDLDQSEDEKTEQERDNIPITVTVYSKEKKHDQAIDSTTSVCDSASIINVNETLWRERVTFNCEVDVLEEMTLISFKIGDKFVVFKFVKVIRL
jgi:hypothetical protein